MPKKAGGIKNIIRGLFSINDTPQKISLGLGLGVFTGIFPGTGPIAALFLASILRVNRAASLVGSLATNTWLSVVIFVISAKTGAFIFGLDWVVEYARWSELIKECGWLSMCKLSFLRLAAPLLVGYILTGLGLGIMVYLACFGALKLFKQGGKNPLDKR